MGHFKSKFFELSCELVIYMILSLLHYIIVTGRYINFEDIYVVIGLWLAVAVYRLVFLQLPISWAAAFWWANGFSYREKVLTGIINFTTFIVVIYLSSLFSPVVAGFLEFEKIFIPGIVLISTTISPVIIYLLLFKAKQESS